MVRYDLLMTEYLKVVFVPGLLPDKWFRRFDERHGERPRGRTRRQIATSRDQQDTPYTVRIASAVVDDPLPYVLREHADVAFIRMDGRGRDGVVSDAEARGEEDPPYRALRGTARRCSPEGSSDVTFSGCRYARP